ncbi:hypothetical protein SASPL_150551 [Salvia splendens]|uniref:DUF985 domain-containing protein n=1 Tax=Salvia splendens TaxID=180675 RepID=A0A8X8W699_SALSN|nr:hypothetical protein SASPL_150551 [Salvia splendens]
MGSTPPKSSQVVAKLNLKPHPEGGFYSETFRDTSVNLSKSHLPPQLKQRNSNDVLWVPKSIKKVSGVKLFAIETVILVFSRGSDIDKVDRPVSTSIYFLLPSGSVSHLHRIPCAEVWHFYLGEPLTVVELNDNDGTVKFTCLGPDPLADNQVVQHTVPPNVWFGAFPTQDIDISSDGAVKRATRDQEAHFSLVGCTCAPAFQFDDFELANRTELVSRFPKYESLITMLTFAE